MIQEGQYIFNTVDMYIKFTQIDPVHIPWLNSFLWMKYCEVLSVEKNMKGKGLHWRQHSTWSLFLRECTWWSLQRFADDTKYCMSYIQDITYLTVYCIHRVKLLCFMHIYIHSRRCLLTVGLIPHTVLLYANEEGTCMLMCQSLYVNRIPIIPQKYSMTLPDAKW